MYGDYQDVYNADPGLMGQGQGGPTGIPDPANPGYDTGGFPLGAGSTQAPTISVTPGHGGTTGSGGSDAPGGGGFLPIDPGTGLPPGTSVAGQPNTPNTTPSIGTGALAPFGEAAPAFPTFGAYQTGPAFTAPTFEEALNSPGLKFRIQQGQEGLQNWAAARGTLNDSGTAKALIDYGQNAGAQGYGDVYARDFNTWQANEDARRQTYGLNRMTQSIDPWTAAFNAWSQRGNWYLQNQGTVANTALGFGSI